MPDPSLSRLTDEELVDLGAALESEQAAVKAELERLSRIVPEARAKLAIPGLKFGINFSVGAAGLFLEPINFGLSMLLTAAGVGTTIWDGVDLGRNAAALIGMQFRNRRLNKRAAEIAAQLSDIRVLLSQRLGPP